MTCAAPVFHAEPRKTTPPIRRSPIHGRLEEWALWLISERPSALPGVSVFQKIRDQKQNAGARADGIRYEIIPDGEGGSVACPPDGGLWKSAQRIGRALAEDARCREIHIEVARLPDELRRVVVRRWVRLHHRDGRMKVSDVARALGIPRQTCVDRIDRAAQIMEQRIYGRVWTTDRDGVSIGHA